MRSFPLLLVLVTGAVLVVAKPQHAAAKTAPPVQVEFLLTDDTRITGRVHRETSETVVVIGPQGVRFEIPRHLIRSRRPLSPYGARLAERVDPNYSRLLLAPTGRPLRVREGYLSDHYVLFPGLSYGVTPHVSLMAGVSVLPGIGLGDQLKYIAPRVAWRVGEGLAVSGGALLVAAEADGDGGSAGIGFAVATVGEVDRSITVGMGLGWTNEKGRDADLLNGPLIGFGGSYRLSRTLALVSESWLITREGVRLGEQPFGLALRFIGERITADLGAILLGETLSEGFPIPWLSFTYHFRNTG